MIMQAPLRTIPSGASSVSPTCHSFCKAADGLDLLCGVSSGDGTAFAPFRMLLALLEIMQQLWLWADIPA